jgi:hypothetical protein
MSPADGDAESEREGGIVLAARLVESPIKKHTPPFQCPC